MGQVALRLQDGTIGHGDDPSARFLRRRKRLLATRRIADANRAGNGLGVFDNVTLDQGGGPSRLNPQEVWQVSALQIRKLTVPHPIGADISCVAYRKSKPVRCASQRFRDLESSRLLALEPVRVERIDQSDWGSLRKTASQA